MQATNSKKKLKIGLLDSTDLIDNFFRYVLAYPTFTQKYDIEYTLDNPDILIFSDFGEENLLFRQHPCKKIFYTSRPQNLERYLHHYSLSPEYHEYHGTNFRLPFYYLHHFHEREEGRGRINARDAERMSLLREKDFSPWKNKTKFCLFPSKNNVDMRTMLWYNTLSDLGEIGFLDEVTDTSEYKFVICFEDESFPGYVTNKLYDGLMSDCIPLYWGSPTVGLDFNEDAFLNYHTYNSDDIFLETIKKYNENEKLYNTTYYQKMANSRYMPLYADIDNTFELKMMIWFERILGEINVR